MIVENVLYEQPPQIYNVTAFSHIIDICNVSPKLLCQICDHYFTALCNYFLIVEEL